MSFGEVMGRVFRDKEMKLISLQRGIHSAITATVNRNSLLNEGHDNIRVMSLKISTDPAPLITDEDGVVRVAGTRVRLETVVYAFNQGASAEEILQQYPSLALSDIYGTISYYLQHRSSVDDHLDERQREHDRVRQANEARSDPAGLRERLLKRKPQN
jgi:uncharacterized protein (DUF433 family)